MSETTAEVRRDIEQTRERMSSTLAQLEQKLNVVQVVKDHPWPALALAFGAGLALSASGADVKAAAVTVGATRGSSTKLGSALDEIVANLMSGVHGALQDRVDGWVDELKSAIGGGVGAASSRSRSYGATRGNGQTAGTTGYGGAIHESPGMQSGFNRAD
jgi:hypothetical protein